MCAEEPEIKQLVTDRTTYSGAGVTTTVTTAALDLDPDAAAPGDADARNNSSSGGSGGGDDSGEAEALSGSSRDSEFAVGAGVRAPVACGFPQVCLRKRLLRSLY